MTAVALFPRDEYFMRLALREAERALDHDDVPIGALVVGGGEVIGAACNERELRGDPTAHAEILALRQASKSIGSWRLLDTVNHRPVVVGGLLADESASLLRAFFAARRGGSP